MENKHHQLYLPKICVTVTELNIDFHFFESALNLDGNLTSVFCDTTTILQHQIFLNPGKCPFDYQTLTSLYLKVESEKFVSFCLLDGGNVS